MLAQTTYQPINQPHIQRSDFTQVPNAVLRNPELSIGAKAAYMVLLSYAWGEGICFPSQETIAGDLGAGERSVRRWLGELKAAGLIRIKTRGQGKSNVYAPTVWAQPKAEAPAPDPKPSQSRRQAVTTASTPASSTDPDRPIWPPTNTQLEKTQVHHPQTPSPAPMTEEQGRPCDDDLASLLIERGITKAEATRLASLYPDQVRAKVEMFDWIITNASHLVTKSKPGFLHRAITHDYTPEEYRRHQERAASRKQDAEQAEIRRAEELRQAEDDLQHQAEDHAKDPYDRARFWLDTVDARLRRLTKQPDLTPAEYAYELDRQAEIYRAKAAAFFERYPHLRLTTQAGEPTDPDQPEIQPPGSQSAILTVSEARTASQTNPAVRSDLCDPEATSTGSTRPLTQRKTHLWLISHRHQPNGPN